MFDLVVHLDRVALWFVGIPEFYRFCRCLTFEHAVFSHTAMTGQELDKNMGTRRDRLISHLPFWFVSTCFGHFRMWMKKGEHNNPGTRISGAGYIRFALVVGPARRETAMVYDVSDTRGEIRHCTGSTVHT
jgi:hypothetical protein